VRIGPVRSGPDFSHRVCAARSSVISSPAWSPSSADLRCGQQAPRPPKTHTCLKTKAELIAGGQRGSAPRHLRGGRRGRPERRCHDRPRGPALPRARVCGPGASVPSWVPLRFRERSCGRERLRPPPRQSQDRRAIRVHVRLADQRRVALWREAGAHADDPAPFMQLLATGTQSGRPASTRLPSPPTRKGSSRAARPDDSLATNAIVAVDRPVQSCQPHQGQRSHTRRRFAAHARKQRLLSENRTAALVQPRRRRLLQRHAGSMALPTPLR
jgi:hypothetical protein